MTRTIARRPRVAAALLGGLLVLLPGACNSTPTEPPPEPGATVRGKVTYQGQPVPYGIVLCYAHGKALKRDTGQFTPSGSGLIGADGSYEIARVPSGPMMVCVATDPEVNLMSFAAPAQLGGSHGAGPPGKGGLPGGGPPGKGGRPPQGGGPPQAGGPAKAGGPPMAGGGPSIGPPPLPKDSKAPRPLAPGAQSLSEEQKRMLKEVHEKYSKVGKSKLTYFVKPRETSVTINIELK
jgi:hypothetical protein